MFANQSIATQHATSDVSRKKSCIITGEFYSKLATFSLDICAADIFINQITALEASQRQLNTGHHKPWHYLTIIVKLDIARNRLIRWRKHWPFVFQKLPFDAICVSLFFPPGTDRGERLNIQKKLLLHLKTI